MMSVRTNSDASEKSEFHHILRPSHQVRHLKPKINRSRSTSKRTVQPVPFNNPNPSLPSILRNPKSEHPSAKFTGLQLDGGNKKNPLFPDKETQPPCTKRVRFRRIRRETIRFQLVDEPKATAPAALTHRSSSKETTKSRLTSRQVGLKKRNAFLLRIQSQEPDVDKICQPRSSESDDVLVRQKGATLQKKTLSLRQPCEIISVKRLHGNIGKGGFGEVSAWEIETKYGRRQRVAVKSFDPLADGFNLALAEASVMVEFENILHRKMLLWFVPKKPRSFPSDFLTPAIIMPLFESRRCISPTLQNLVFDHKIIQPKLSWIRETMLKILFVLFELHSAGWAHGDLHAGNIMLHSREIILIDYSKANRKNRPYVYSLDKKKNWVECLDWIEPSAVTGQDCCSRASDIWSLGKLTNDLLATETCKTLLESQTKKDSQHLIHLKAFVHLAFHRRQFRPDVSFLIDMLKTNDFSNLSLCSCEDDCEMLQK